MAIVAYGPNLELPWSSSENEDQRFKRILGICLGVGLLFALVMPLLPVPELTREEQETLPPQLARVVLQEQELPKPEVIKPEPKPQEKKPEPKPEPKPKPKPEPKPEPQPVDVVQKAREAAASAGLMQFKDDLAAMRDTVDTQQLAQASTTRVEAEAAKVERSVITGKAAAGSGGIDTAALSRDTGGVALSGKEDVAVDSPINQASASRRSGGGAAAQAGGRSDASVRRTMDANKGAIFAIYHRALRKDPTLQGKLVFEMVIEPSGEVSGIKLLSSELGDQSLIDKILARIRLINFGAEKVLKTRVNYSLDFLPY